MHPLPTMLHLRHQLPGLRFPLSDTVVNFNLVSLHFMHCHHLLLFVLCSFVHFSAFFKFTNREKTVTAT